MLPFPCPLELSAGSSSAASWTTSSYSSVATSLSALISSTSGSSSISSVSTSTSLPLSDASLSATSEPSGSTDSPPSLASASSVVCQRFCLRYSRLLSLTRSFQDTLSFQKTSCQARARFRLWQVVPLPLGCGIGFCSLPAGSCVLQCKLNTLVLVCEKIAVPHCLVGGTSSSCVHAQLCHGVAFLSPHSWSWTWSSLGVFGVLPLLSALVLGWPSLVVVLWVLQVDCFLVGAFLWVQGAWCSLDPWRQPLAAPRTKRPSWPPV